MTISPISNVIKQKFEFGYSLYDEKQAEEENRTKLGIVQVPSLLERFIILPSEGQKHKFILLEDVISSFTHKLFTGYTVSSVTRFRITRNADLTIHEEGARDLLKVIEKN